MKYILLTFILTLLLVFVSGNACHGLEFKKCLDTCGGIRNFQSCKINKSKVICKCEKAT